MKLFVYLTVGWLFLNAYAICCIKTQQLGLWVWKACLEQEKEQDKPLESRQTFFHVGCTFQMNCTYMDNHCDDKESVRLNVFHRTKSLNIHEVNRTKCSLVFEIRNLTQNDEGCVVCNDTINGHWRQREFKVGYPPVPPENWTIVFKPGRSLVLLVDRIKTGKDLNDENTQWNVNYSWRHSHECSKEGQEIDAEDGRFIACYLNLKGKYERHGQYGEELGSMYSPVNFTVSVTNMFGATPVSFQTFYPQDYVKPSLLRDVQVRIRGDSWILLKVTFPHGIEKRLCKNMSENRSSTFKIEYTVSSLSEDTQHRLGNSNIFHELYGFYRNLDSDMAALNRTDTVSTSSLFKQGVLEWPNCSENISDINITGLPLPNTYYNISVRAGGRYWSPSLEIDTSKGTKTAETMPSESPQFYDSFYFCQPPENECVTCIVYFKEIPRPLRGGDVLNYSLNGARRHGSGIGNNCSSAKNFTVVTGGQNNTIVVENLAPQAVYYLDLWATVTKGLSPSSKATLNTSTSADIVAKSLHVVVERHGESYDVSWSVPCTASSIQVQECPSNITYFVHHCYADAFQVGSNQWDQPNCMTNLVTEQVNSSTRIKTISLPFQRGRSLKDLEPAIFVSMQTSDGAHSPLVKPECLYDFEKGAEQQEGWLDVENLNSHALLVKFQHKCINRYFFGRPNKLCVAVTELGNVKSECPKLLDNSQIFCEEDVKPNVRMVHTFSNLKPDTKYCVGLKALKRSTDSSWAFKVEETRSPDGNGYATAWITISAMTTLAAAVAVILVLIYCYKRKASKFASVSDAISKLPWQRDKHSQYPITLIPPDLPPKNTIIEDRSNSMFRNMPADNSNDSGVELNREPSDKSAPMRYNDVDQSQEQRQRQSSRMDSRSSDDSEYDDLSQPITPLSFLCNQPNRNIFISRYGPCTPGPFVPEQPQEDGGDDIDNDDNDDGDVDDGDDDNEEEAEDEEEDDDDDHAGAVPSQDDIQHGEHSNTDNTNCQDKLRVYDGSRLDQIDLELLPPDISLNDPVLEAARKCLLEFKPVSPLSMQSLVPLPPCTMGLHASHRQTERKDLTEGEPSFAEKIKRAKLSTHGFSVQPVDGWKGSRGMGEKLDPSPTEGLSSLKSLEDNPVLLAAASLKPQPVVTVLKSEKEMMDTATVCVASLKKSLAVPKSEVEEDSPRACAATSSLNSTDGCMNKEVEVCATSHPPSPEEPDIFEDLEDLDILDISNDPILRAAKNCPVNSPPKLGLENGILLKLLPQHMHDSGAGDLTCDGNFDDSSEEAEMSLLLRGDKETFRKNTKGELTTGEKSKLLGLQSEKRRYCKVTEK